LNGLGISPHLPSSGEKAKALDILDAIRTLQRLERERRLPDQAERQALARFGGFGAVALSLFPDPVAGTFKSPAWEALGQDLESLITPEEYESAKRTTFNAFYTSPVVVRAMFEALSELGVSKGATVLEPGCGSGNFMAIAPQGMHFIGVELDRLSGRIARALYPSHDIRIENFRDTRLPEGRIDAVIGNPPFADLKLDYAGMRLSLHDYFFAKSLDALKPGGVLALVTSHFTLDKRNGEVREQLAGKADFLGAVRLPSDAFRREGTSVVTDIVFLRKRPAGEPPRHSDSAWLEVGMFVVEGSEVSVNRYFLAHPEMVLGQWSRKDRLYGGSEGYSVTSTGDLANLLPVALKRLPRPERAVSAPSPSTDERVPTFIPPPTLDHIAEGSFFVGPGRAICQSLNGEAVPVNYGGTNLRSNGTLVGRRLAALIDLRDHARRVLRSQNEGWPEPDRKDARRALNRVYDRFTSAYGPINRTSVSETANGSVIRRMPNLVKFREDPDAMLVMSLENFDEVMGTATKAAIMTKDVVGRAPPITSVRTAEEGLLVSLDHRGAVDLPYIASLYGVLEERVVHELSDLIYRDPESHSWQTADAYLSGDVRAKLRAAEPAGPEFARNAEALRAVQPEDVLPGDIDANLGAPWIPVCHVESFAAELFGVASSAVRIGHLKKDAVWSIDFDYQVERSVAATSDFGTARANGTWLFELALNLKTPVIYDTIQTGDGETRVVNQDETLAAREKQKLLKERFRSWVFTDPERTEQLVRIYNDTYNNLRPRLFDGSHLDFPGMNRTITLNPHQKDAVWRAMSSGNTLLAHAVGAGKTYTMATAGMKMRAAGLLKKPMYVVPNHMLEQFSREFMQLYPNARLLVATKEDLTRERRKVLTAKVASGEWDGIIVTHSSFERIGMSRGYQERFLREQIREYDELLRDVARGDASRGHRNLIKAIEKQKARREERLKDLLAEDKKDDGLVFDELGVDHLFVDEAHCFKNLETPTKMERVAGIQTGGSERAFDLYMKARYLHEDHPGHGLTFATGTPISNTMVEMYTMQRFLDPDGLTRRGIEHFDAWAATFGEVVDTMEISPDGASLRPRSRFARFINLPELQQMFRAFSDVQTAEMLNLPRPNLSGDKAQIVACPMSDEQHSLQEGLVARYERLRSQKIDPRVDNALAITTDGRKLALDARLLTGDAPDFPDSKVNAAVTNIEAIWRATGVFRGTQLVFSDMGVHPTPWGYSAYEEITSKLVARGIPREQIAAIGDADTDAKTQALFEKVRNGTVRVLIGSTQKMGTGTNVQRRLIALHHLDAPWKPAEVEQREGRILRQGNDNEEVSIFRYVTEQSFDAYMWQALETKARFISQVMTGDCAARRAEDIGSQELSYAEVKAIASGNPAVLTLAEADAELQRLSVLRKNHADEQFLARRNLRDLPEIIDRQRKRLADLMADLETLRAHADDPIAIDERSCRRDDVQALLADRLDSLPEGVKQTRRVPLGVYHGLRFGVVLHPHSAPEVFLEGVSVRHASLSRDFHGPRAVMNAVERLASSTGTQCVSARNDLALSEGQLRDYEARLGRPFPHSAYQADLMELRDRLKVALSATSTEPGTEAAPNPQELAERIRALKESYTLDSPPQAPRLSTRSSTAERPVTARIRDRQDPAPTAREVEALATRHQLAGDTRDVLSARDSVMTLLGVRPFGP
jgi:N12 class adenine-specific DNA methylase